MDSRGCKSLNQFDSEDEEEDSDDLVIIEEDDSEVEGDLFL